MYDRRLAKTLFDLKFRDLSIVNVQGIINSHECTAHIQIFDNHNLDSPFKLTILKHGTPPKVPIVK